MINNRKQSHHHLLASVLAFILLSLGGNSAAWAQVDLNSGLNNFGFGSDGGEDFTVEADFRIDEGTQKGSVEVRVTLAPGWHIYSSTQPPGGPLRTAFKVEASDDYTVGEFIAKTDPLMDENDPIFNMLVEYYEDEAAWSAPIEIREGVDPKSVRVRLTMTGQRCESGCIPIKENLSAKFAGYNAAAPGAVQSPVKFRPQHGHVLFTAQTSAATAVPGSSIQLSITAEPTDGYHIYSLGDGGEPPQNSLPTLILFSKIGKWTAGPPQAKGEATSKTVDGKNVSYYAGPVTWEVTLEVPKDQPTGTSALIGGSIAFQTCTDSTCDRPHSVDFEVNIPVAEASESGSQRATFSDGKNYNKIQELIEKYGASRKGGGIWKDQSAIFVLAMAFVAGLILNFMPCVLPVIGLKIMSFVHQAGSSHSRLVMLNVVFTLGILSVFMVLATLAMFFGFGWGDLYKDVRFTIVMVSVLFAFALSFCGVWEIPIPGFVGTAGGSAQKQEGVVGAFVKGVFSTLLATPCAGPLLVPAVVWAVAQPPLLTYLTFLMLGLGMAFPYLFFGAFPALVKMLPRPGVWMETFKILMGFLLLGSVVFFIQAVGKKYMSSTLLFLVILGFACWMFGHVSAADHFAKRARQWLSGVGVIAVGAFVSFYMLIPQYELHWEPYSKGALEKYLAEGRPVFVDATAEWCATCKSNEFLSFNRKATFDFFKENNIAALKADYTNESPEIAELLDGFGNTTHGLPYYAIYHPQRSEPIHFGATLMTRPADLISRLKPGLVPEGQAGSSGPASSAAEVSSADAGTLTYQ
jgi:thiol:disulfide interchange protein